MFIRLAFASIVECIIAGCQPRVALEETPVSVAIPDGFVLDTAVYTQNPSLHFRFGPDGMGELYPELSIEQIESGADSSAGAGEPAAGGSA